MKIIVIANYKGGVGKSSTALFISEHFALRGKRVLVIDLDPQANLSLMLLSRDGLVQHELGGKTVPHLFQARLNGGRQGAFTFVVERASDLHELNNLSFGGLISILPTTPRLFADEYVFDRSIFGRGQDPIVIRLQILRDFLAEIQQQYDCIVIDCPPGFGSMSQAALQLADRVIAPTLADQVSMRSLADFVQIGLQETLQLDVAGLLRVVVSRYTSTREQQDRLVDLRRDYRVLEPPIPQRDAMSRIAEHQQGVRRYYRGKYRLPLVRPIGPHVQKMCEALFKDIFE